MFTLFSRSVGNFSADRSGDSALPSAKYSFVYENDSRWVPHNGVPRPNLRNGYGPCYTNLSEEERNHLIYRNVRSILNKLTPECFDKLTSEILDIGIDTPDVLKGIVVLIYEKALAEPRYCPLYALLCKELCERAPNFEAPSTPFTTARLILLAKCQVTFGNRRSLKKDLTDSILGRESPSSLSGGHGSGADSDGDPQLESYRRKLLGNVQFIGELGKLGLVREKVLHDCIQQLLRRKHKQNTEDIAEDLDCLSRFLQTVGSRLDHDKGKNLMDQYFARMKYFQEQVEFNLPKRIRFKLQDVLELRENGWKDRRPQSKDANPVRVSFIREEAAAKDNVYLTPPNARNIGRFIPSMNAGMMRPPMSYGGGPMLGMDNYNVPYGYVRDHYSLPYDGMRGAPRYMNADKIDMKRGENSDFMGNGLPCGMQQRPLRPQRMPLVNRNPSCMYDFLPPYVTNVCPVNKDFGRSDVKFSSNNRTSGTQGGSQAWPVSEELSKVESSGPKSWCSDIDVPPMDTWTSNGGLTSRNGCEPLGTDKIPPRVHNKKESAMIPQTSDVYTSKPSLGLPPIAQSPELDTTSTMSRVSENGTVSLSSGSSSSRSYGATCTDPSAVSRSNVVSSWTNLRLEDPPFPIQVAGPVTSRKDQTTKPMTVGKRIEKPNILVEEKCASRESRMEAKNSKLELEKQISQVLNAYFDGLLVPTVAEKAQFENLLFVNTLSDSEKESIGCLLIRVAVVIRSSKDVDNVGVLLCRCIVSTCVQAESESLRDGGILILQSFMNQSSVSVTEKDLIIGLDTLLRQTTLYDTIPLFKSRIARLLALCLAQELVVFKSCHLLGGDHHPFFLLLLQHCVKVKSQTWLLKIFQESQLVLQDMMIDSERSRDRMTQNLLERGLSFLQPELQVKEDLTKALDECKTNNIIDGDGVDRFNQWITDNIDDVMMLEKSFVQVLVASIVNFAYDGPSLSTPDGSPCTVNAVQGLHGNLVPFLPVLKRFLTSDILKLAALYALQVYAHSKAFPKGLMNRLFYEFYELDLVEESVFNKWREEITSEDEYPGKGKALIQVNKFLTWLDNASEEEEADSEQ